ncbi:MAG: hypothetical protein KF824_07925 [Fimbriimonadaceae bacterium]|nr:MAG: hypothetical protein KF824_07925 [Fimbriimonadaceae bacterium]
MEGLGISRLIQRIASGTADPQAILVYGSDSEQLAEAAHQLVSFWLKGDTVAGIDFAREVDAQKIVSSGAGNQIVLKNIVRVKSPDEDENPVIPVVEYFRTRPLMMQKKAVWIEHAERLNSEASNAFLKTLEELPGYARTVLTTTNLGRVLPTIRSRCLCVAAPFEQWEEHPPQLPLEIAWGKNKGELQFIRENVDCHTKLWDLLQLSLEAPPMAAVKFSEETRKIAEELSKSTVLSIRESQVYIAELVARWWLSVRPYDPSVATACSDLCRMILGYGNAGIGFDVLFGTILVHNRELSRNVSQ